MHNSDAYAMWTIILVLLTHEFIPSEWWECEDQIVSGGL